MLENHLTPEMRLVQGSAFARQDKDLAGKPFKKDDGTPYTKGFIALAGQKGNAEIEAFRKLLMDQGPVECPQFFPGGVCNRPNFSYKIIDGDGVDQNGQPNNTKEGFAGHWVFRMSTMFEIKAFPTGKYGIADQMTQTPGGPEPFGRGNYVRAIITVKSNGDANKPGLAVYPSHVEFMRAGAPITSGPSAASLFGQAGGAPAPGGGPIYTMTPAATATREAYHASGWSDAQLIAGNLMTVQTPAAAPPPAPAAPAAPAAPLPPGGSAPAPAPPAQTAVAAGAPGYKMADANGPAYAAYIGQGWTNAALVQNQIMVPL